MAGKVFFALSLLLVAVVADNFGAEFGPTGANADDYIETAGGANQAIEGLEYSVNKGSWDELRYLGHHVESDGRTWVLGFTPYCSMTHNNAGHSTGQTCGLHSFELTGHTADADLSTHGYVTEVLLTHQGVGYANLQWEGDHAIHQIDTGNELDWTSQLSHDFYVTVWVVDSAGGLFHLHDNCETGLSLFSYSASVLCLFTSARASVATPTDGSGNSLGVQWVSSGGSYDSSSGVQQYCNVGVIASDNNAYYGRQTTDSDNGCSWAPITGTGPGNVISIANAVNDFYVITQNGSSYRIYSYNGLATAALSLSLFTEHTTAWTAVAGTLNPVFIDAWDSSHVRVVAQDGSLWSFDGTNFALASLPSGVSGVFVTTYPNAPTNAYLSVGPDAVYFSDSNWGSTGTNWRLAYS